MPTNCLSVLDHFVWLTLKAPSAMERLKFNDICHIYIEPIFPRLFPFDPPENNRGTQKETLRKKYALIYCSRNDHGANFEKQLHTTHQFAGSTDSS